MLRRALAVVIVSTRLVAFAAADGPLLECDQRAYGTGLTTTTQGDYPQGHVLVDIDGNGDLGALCSGGASIGLFGSIALYRNNGAGAFGAPESFAVNIGSAGDFTVADVTLDRRPDILCVGHSNEYSFSVAPSAPSGFGASFRLRAREMARSICAVDVDGDGEITVNIGTEPPIGAAVSVLFGSGPPPAIQTYCTAGTTTGGCNALLSWTGAPSLGADAGFVVRMDGADGQRQGLVCYGQSGQSAFAGGASSSFLCVKPPTQRTTGGTIGQCDGALALDGFPCFATHPAALGASLQAGSTFDVQA